MKKTIFLLPRLIYEICYQVGLTLVRTWYYARRKLQQKWANRGNLRLNFTLSAFLILAILTVSGFHLATLVVSGQTWKGQVLGEADQGLGHLSEAQQLLQKQDLNGANEQLALALRSFERSRADLNSNNIILQSLLDIVPQKQDADQLLEATALFTQAGQDWAQFYALSQTVRITPQGITQRNEGQEQPGSVLTAMNQHLQAGRQKTQQALQLVAAVDPDILPADKRPLFMAAQDNLQVISTAVDSVSEVFNLLYTALSGERNVLLLFQNNTELRATGGFMGTFGAMQLKDGQINSLHISSIYDLDGQLKENIAPPRPVSRIIPQWYLRDTNWFADFPLSAQVITRFYEKEGGETPDLIITATPQLIIDLLKITGPVTLSRYNATFTAENFVELSQFESSVNYDRVLNQPKQVLADFFPALLQKISDLSGPQLLPVLGALQQNLLHKQVLLYSRDATLQGELEKFNWAGVLKSTDRDYLLVSTSNLGGTKTDTAISQTIDLSSELTAEGQLTNTLTITRSNPLAQQEQFKNTSFLRVYVPAGSQLISAQGFTPLVVPLPKVDNQKYDPDVLAWEQAAVNDNLTGTMIGRESGKTIFGNWVELEGGQTRTIVIKYRLPFILKNLDHHSLLLQKQPGTLNQEFTYTLIFDHHRIAWKNFQPRKLESRLLQVANSLDQDYFYGLILERPWSGPFAPVNSALNEQLC